MPGVLAGRVGPVAAEPVFRVVGETGTVEAAPPLIVGVASGELLIEDDLLIAVQGRLYELDRLVESPGGVPRWGGTPRRSAAGLLAHAWRQHGERLISELRGEFVVLVWDLHRKAGVIACDALGNRTVYYSHDGRGLCFGAEVRDVLALLSACPSPDPAGVAHWLAGGGPPIGRTLYDGIHRLPGGGLLRFDASGQVMVDRWWNPSFAPSPRSAEETASELRHLLTSAVSRRVAADHRSGILLSGGLDSASVAGVAAGLRPNGVIVPGTYSAVFPDHPSVDESARIDLLRRDLGLDAQTYAARSGSLIGSAAKFIAIWKLPPSSPNLFFWIPLLGRARADGVRLMLDGEGGDELFGPARYLIADLLRGGRYIGAWRLAHRLPGAGDRPPKRRVAWAVSQYGARAALSTRVHEALRSTRRSDGVVDPWMRPEIAAALRQSDETWSWRRSDAPRWWAGLLHSVTGGDGPVQSRDHIRQRSAQAGLDATHPLLDEDVVAFVLASDPRLSFDPDVSRPLLRASMAGTLPDAIRLRPSKSYFDAVFYESLRRVDVTAVQALLGDRRARLGTFVDLPQLRYALIEKPTMPPRAWAAHTWRAVTLELWLRHLAGEPIPPLA